MKRAVAIGLVATLCWLRPTPAEAASPADQAVADALFQEGKKLAAAGDFEHACPKLAESNRLDPGAGTLLNLGDCYEKWGKLTSAWSTFNDADRTARNLGDNARADEAARRAEKLAPRLARLTIVVPSASRIPGLEVRRDGSVIGEGQWGTAVPIDPGDHTVEVKAPGRKPWLQHISPTGPDGKVTVPALEPEAAIVAGPRVPETPSRAPSSSPPPDAPTSFWTTRRVAAAGVGAGGVVGLVVGGVLGGLALSKNSSSKADCSPTNTNACNPAGTSLRSTAVSLGNGSTAAFAIGGALAVTSIVLFATAPSASPSVEVRASASGWSLRTTF